MGRLFQGCGLVNEPRRLLACQMGLIPCTATLGEVTVPAFPIVYRP